MKKLIVTGTRHRSSFLSRNMKKTRKQEKTIRMILMRLRRQIRLTQNNGSNIMKPARKKPKNAPVCISIGWATEFWKTRSVLSQKVVEAKARTRTAVLRHASGKKNHMNHPAVNRTRSRHMISSST